MTRRLSPFCSICAGGIGRPNASLKTSTSCAAATSKSSNSSVWSGESKQLHIRRAQQNKFHFYRIFHRNSYDRFTILLLTFFIFYGIIRLLRGGSPSPVQLSTVIRSRLIQALWLCLVALIELLCRTHWSIRVKILRLLPRSFFSLPRRSRLLHFFTHVITNILPAVNYLQAFCFCHLSESAPYIKKELSATFLPPKINTFALLSYTQFFIFTVIFSLMLFRLLSFEW